jgi:hypothetical protein
MHHNTDETRDPMNRYPEELMRRLYDFCLEC